MLHVPTSLAETNHVSLLVFTSEYSYRYRGFGAKLSGHFGIIILIKANALVSE